MAAGLPGEAFWERAERLTALRRREQQHMQEYVSLTSGHMDFLIRALDGEPQASPAAVLPPLPATVDESLVRAAVAFLRHTRLPVEPRRQWPQGGLPRSRQSGRIAAGRQARPGLALCFCGDAGWGSLVRQGRQEGHFADDLVAACVALVREWQPQPAPAWVTCIPSRRRTGLVPDFARRLAAALGLPFHAVLEKTEERPEQRTMANSLQQARNVDGSFAVVAPTLPAGPVLLVDDTVGSRWTLTFAAWLLRSHGSAEVFPLALALSGPES
jgi:ATP-dependent DNA helicase RecQ